MILYNRHINVTQFRKKLFFLILSEFCLFSSLQAQQQLRNGFYFPLHNRDVPLHILIISIELKGGKCNEINNPPCFKQGEIPSSIDDYFDPVLKPNGPEKYFSKYLYQASLGQFIVLGDYLDKVVYLDFCPDGNPSNNNWADKINTAVKEQFGDTLPLHHSTPLSYFDRYNLDNSKIAGVQKDPSPNSKFDCIVYLVKNYPVFSGYAGYGLNLIGSSKPLLQGMGVDIGGVFGHTGNVASIKFIMEEFFHAMFGGNNWHNGGGKYNHTFFAHTRPWGIPSQHGLSQVVSGYDRWIFDWTNPPEKNFSISARDINNNEAKADLQLPGDTASQIFILRDFVSSGDVIRIKLPHIDYGISGPEKNQYLWLENHQLLKENIEDQNTNHTLANTPLCDKYPECGEHWTPGVFAAIQVGKDIIEGTNLYSPPNSHPNGLGSWMFPLTADGNFDFKYSNIVHPPYSHCTGTIPYVLFDKRQKWLPNPFSGYSYLYGQPNTDSSLRLFDKDVIQGVGYISEKGDTVMNRSAYGGRGTAFNCDGSCPENGKKIFSLSTNPSPVPVMTLTSGDNHKSVLKIDPGKVAYENRTIYLNGISVSILDNNFEPERFGNGTMKIKIRWNDYEVNQDVRWCADSIRLGKNSFDSSDYSLLITDKSTVLVDRGLSPAYDYSDSVRKNFTVPTTFSCLPDSKIKIESGSLLVIDNGSTLELDENSMIKIFPGARIMVKNKSKLIMKPGSVIEIGRKAKVIVDKSSEFIRHPGSDVRKVRSFN